MIIIFDLDNTLLNTAAVKRKLAWVLGITPQKFQETYYLSNQKGKYNFYRHLECVSRLDEKDEKKCLSNLNKVMKNLDKYLYKNSESLIKNLAKEKNYLILLTYGNRKWQKEKVKNLKIKKYFKKIIFAEKCKSHSLDFLKTSKERIIFVNDNAKECKKIKKIYPNIEIFLVDGKYAHNIKHDFKINKLKNVLKLECLKNNTNPPQKIRKAKRKN